MIYNIRLLLEYDGTNYCGWQRQAASHGKVGVGDTHPTIQGTLEEVLTRITKQTVKIAGAGRTDTGVHATGQVANFKSALKLKESSWVKAINSLLPPDIIVKNAEYVPAEFHARFSAKSKVYRYIILNSEQSSPFLRNYVWHIKRLLDVPLMKEASGCLIGKHDFSSFRASGRASNCSAKSPVRTLDRLEITMVPCETHICQWLTMENENQRDKGVLALSEAKNALPIDRRGFSPQSKVHPVGMRELIFFTFNARSYLQHMVRNIVGTLVEAGRGKLTPSDVKSILEKEDRRCAGPIAPPQGLYLAEVRYD